jgi:adenine/guanine/hypoxanthine permease
MLQVPQLLNKNDNGFDEQKTAVAFVLTTFVASVLSGVFSNLPVPCGPGLGGATFTAYSILNGLSEKISEDDRKEALTICFISGVFMLILSPLAILLVSLSPDSVKHAIPVGLGMIFALNGFLEMELIETDADIGLKLHSFSVRTVLAMSGLVLIALLHQKGFHTGMLIPIVGVTLISWISNITSWPDAVVGTYKYIKS